MASQPLGLAEQRPQAEGAEDRKAQGLKQKTLKPPQAGGAAL